MKKILLAAAFIVLISIAVLRISKKDEPLPGGIQNQETDSSEITIEDPTKMSNSEDVSAGSTVPVTVSKSSTTSTNTPRTNANRTNAEWKKILTPSQYAVLRESGTEVPYTSALLDEKRAGTYVTADCGIPVFRSEQKFDSGTGWPSFWAPISAQSVKEIKDTTEAEVRTEVRAKECDSHLGHVFDDAPQTPTGLRYCINGVALRFIPD